MVSESFTERGGSWVLGQGVFMLAVLVLGPISAGESGSSTTAWAGAFLAVAGALLGIAGVRSLRSNRTPFPKPQPGSQLVQEGVYRLVRHPLYTSVILLAAAWSLLWRSGPAGAAALVLALFLDAKARREERWLRQKFPAYSEYARRVSRLVPWVYMLSIIATGFLC